ncbi:two-component system, sensor kinase [Arthrobacter sp. PAMC 25486]|nr:two-component system, sensor kinase [Arthrobacter sp. PAMC 25486]
MVSVAGMEKLMNVLRIWGAPLTAVVFTLLWLVGEAGRMGPWPGLPTWNGTMPLLLSTASIAVSAWKHYVSLGFTAALLLGQLLGLIPPMEANHWPIYVGSFMALAFIQWTGDRRARVVSVGSNAVFLVLMTILLMAGQYGDGVGWYSSPDGQLLNQSGGEALNRLVFSLWVGVLLLLIAVGFAAAGRTLSLYEERGGLFQDRNLAVDTLRQTEVDLIIEQERSRISRDLHDVLAHSLAVIAAQSDGARYISAGQPQPVLNALENISSAARSALVDAQRVIEGAGDGVAAPQPRFSDVLPLIERMRQGSLKISHTELGTPVELTTGAQVAVFRIVQECLTNALKHGGRGIPVIAHFDWSGPGLTLHISSDVPDTATHQAEEPRQGRGIAGMRERAHLAGGWMSAGPDGQQFRVTVFLPYGMPQDMPDGVGPAIENGAECGGSGQQRDALETAAAAGSGHSG